MIANSSFDPSYLWLPLVGMGIGILVTMFGGGGGFFYVPILTLLFRVPTQLAAATSLAATIPTVVVGSLEHYRQGNINMQFGIIFGVAGLVGAFAGAYLSALISSALLQKLFGVYAIILTIPMALTSRKRFKNQGNEGTEPPPLTNSKIILSSFFGILSGIMAGLFGTSGTASIVAGLYILGLPVTLVVGTSVMVVLFNVLSGFVGHLVVGQFDMLLFLLLGCGAVLGAFLGPRLLNKINVQLLEKVYGVLFTLLVIGFGLIMFFK
jgi:uncharacterized membrane protein YfcA